MGCGQVIVIQLLVFRSREVMPAVIVVIIFRAVLALRHFELPLNSRIPVVFDSVVGAAWKPLRDERPSVAQPSQECGVLFMSLNDRLVLLLRPSLLLDVGIEVVMPPLPALLPDASR